MANRSTNLLLPPFQFVSIFFGAPAALAVAPPDFTSFTSTSANAPAFSVTSIRRNSHPTGCRFLVSYELKVLSFVFPSFSDQISVRSPCFRPHLSFVRIASINLASVGAVVYTTLIVPLSFFSTAGTLFS